MSLPFVKFRFICFKGLIGQQGRHALLSSAWLAIERIIRLLGGLVVTVATIRYLSPNDFGLLTFALAIIAMLHVITQLGLNKVVIRNLVQVDFEPRFTQKILTSALVVRLGVSVIMILSLHVFQLFSTAPVMPLLVIVSFSLVFQAFDTIDLYFQAKVISKYTVIAKSLAFIVMGFLKLILIFLGANVFYFACAYVGELALATCFLAWVFYNKVPSFKLFPKPDLRLLSQSVRESWPEVIAGLTVLTMMKMDQIMLGKLVDMTAVGYYAAAASLSEVFYSFPVIVSTATYPLLVKAKSESSVKIYSRLSQLFRINNVVFYIIIAATFFIAETVVKLLFGETYHVSADILRIHVIGGLFLGLGLYSNSWFVIEKKSHWSMQRSLLGAACNVLLNCILIPLYGVNGAAFSTVFSMFVAFFLFDLIHYSSRVLFKIKLNSFFLR